MKTHVSPENQSTTNKFIVLTNELKKSYQQKINQSSHFNCDIFNPYISPEKSLRRQYTTTIFLLHPPRELIDLTYKYKNNSTVNDKNLKDNSLDQNKFIINTKKEEESLVKSTDNNYCNTLSEFQKNNEEKNLNNQTLQISNIKHQNSAQHHLTEPNLEFTNNKDKTSLQSSTYSNNLSDSSFNTSTLILSSACSRSESSNSINNLQLLQLPRKQKKNNKNYLNANVDEKEGVVNEKNFCLEKQLLNNNIKEDYQKSTTFETLFKNFLNTRKKNLLSQNHKKNFQENLICQNQSNHFRYRISSVLCPRKSIMTSSFRGLKRAASSSTTSINFCTPTSSALAILSKSNISLCNSSTFSYPYPRSHTPLMVLPSRSGSTVILNSQNLSLSNNNTYKNSKLLNYSPKNLEKLDLNNNIVSNNHYSNNSYICNINQKAVDSYVKKSDYNQNFFQVGNEEPENPNLINFCVRNSRPPLNKAIPPIPESKSNESIILVQSQALAEVLNKKMNNTEILNNNNANDNNNNNIAYNNCVVIENRMAQNLASNTATNVNTSTVTTCNTNSSKFFDNFKFNQNKKNFEVPKSPLISVAHLMRNRFSKFGNRLNRSHECENDEQKKKICLSKSFNAMTQSETKKSQNDKSKKDLKKNNLPKSVSLEESTSKNQFKRFLLNSVKQKRPNIEIFNNTVSTEWSSKNDLKIPRRLPATTLIPANIGIKSLPTRLPPDEIPISDEKKIFENLVQPKKNYHEVNVELKKSDDNMIKQVHFKENLIISKTSPIILKKSPELKFIQLNKVNSNYSQKLNNDNKNTKDLFNIQSCSVNNKNLSNTKIPPTLNFYNQSNQQKLTQSFFSMSNSECITQKKHKKPPPRSLSIGTTESMRYLTDQQITNNGQVEIKKNKRLVKNQSLPSWSFNQSKKKTLFSTRSFKLAASLIAEASPRICRATKIITMSNLGKNETINSEKLPNRSRNRERRLIRFRKSVSVPNKELKKNNKKKNMQLHVSSLSLTNENLKPDTVQKIKNTELSKINNSKPNIRTINHVKRDKNLKAPLAEIESSRIAENSPAVEFPPQNFETFQTKKNLLKINTIENQKILFDKGQDFSINDVNNNSYEKKTNYISETKKKDDLKEYSNTDKFNNEKNSISLDYVLYNKKNNDSSSTSIQLFLELTPLKKKENNFDDDLFDKALKKDISKNSFSDIKLIDDISLTSTLPSPVHTPVTKQSQKPSKIAKWNYSKTSPNYATKKFLKEKSLQQSNFNIKKSETKDMNSNITNEKNFKNIEQEIINGSNNLISNKNSLTNFFPIEMENLKITNRSDVNEKVKNNVTEEKNEDITLLNENNLSLPNIISEFKTQLVNLQNSIEKDFEEITQLKLVNDQLQQKLAEKDHLIDFLRSQLVINKDKN